MTESTSAAPRTPLGERLLGAAPILLAFLTVSSLYVWQASRHPTPWLFSDEIEYAQISRAIAESGKPARRGVEYWGAGLFPWLIAPFWWFDNLQTAYDAVKTFNALVMTAAIFPTYGLARMLMPRPYALLAGVGAVVAPSFIYSAMVMQEPVAYLVVAGAFYLAARAITAPSRWNIVVAAAVAFVAPFVRDQLILVPALMIGAVGVHFVCFGKGRVILRKASPARRVAVGVAAVVMLALAVVLVRSGSGEAKVAFDSPGAMLDQGLWAWGALAVGLGVLPVVIGLAMLVPSTAIARTRSLGAFTAVFVASVALFTAYVAVKGAYEAATFEPRISAVEFLLIGGVAGLIGGLLGAGFSALVLRRIWETEMTFAVVPVLTAVAATALLANFTGWAVSARILGQKPLEVLREE